MKILLKYYSSMKNNLNIMHYVNIIKMLFIYKNIIHYKYFLKMTFLRLYIQVANRKYKDTERRE